MTDSTYIPPHLRALHQAGLKYLLLVQLMTLLAFLPYLPGWFFALFLVVGLWRWRVLHGQMRKPPAMVLWAAVLMGLGALMASGLNRYSLDSAVALCLLGYLLKSLEVLRRRDGIFQIYLGYFLAGVLLLYRFDPIAALIVSLLLFFNTLALQAVTAGGHYNARYGLTQSSLILLAALPIMVAGYLFFPRLPPLWQIPNDQRGAQTGMTDEISPGSVERLAQSVAPVFRVAFDTPLPARNQWYWRGNTLSVFDGRSWQAEYRSANPFAWPSQAKLPSGVGPASRYSVLMENSGQRWLYFLDWPSAIEAGKGVILPDARAASRTPITSLLRYRASSHRTVNWPDQSGLIASNVLLPEQGNEPLRQWAQTQRAQYASDGDFIDGLMHHIRTEGFFYTLQPPAYPGDQSLADFWLTGRRGFCSHYASAMGYILRSVGIPTRLVGGYLGGTYNPTGDYVQVRQMEAHVWLEVWLGQGWQRIDPTAAVAPDRIEMNLDTLFRRSQPGDLPLLSRMGSLSLLNGLSLYWDSVLYQWQVLILDYDNSVAKAWFESAFGRFSPLKLAIAILSLMALVGFALAWGLGMLTWPTRQREPYRSLARIERWYGARADAETVQTYFQRLAAQHPSHSALWVLADLIERSLYRHAEPIAAREFRAARHRLVKQRRRRSL